MLDEIKELVKNNPGQLTEEEYFTIAKIIDNKKPCNLLIFGLGNDSSFWLKLNQNGETVFIEDHNEWYDKITKKISNIKAHLVSYNTRRKDYKELLHQHKQLELSLPPNILNTKWDIIFVDAPTSYNDNTPGRMKSIYMAAKLSFLSGGNTHVIVHDCHREAEQLYCDTFLSDKNLINSVNKLRIYFINSDLKNPKKKTNKKYL
ncbi:TIGR01627 domain-containing protein [Priestia megaterium]|uniref:TIGR01627 domain-containing protein n=1 Tax=Priestia megaterium TaxID=1404 RepID=UPI0029FE7195|nr:TIGR01627 domain-containing protein [Bacillus sp. ET1]MED3816027.1 TIGR01627 domain-containing protein [Priestia megaterium]